MSKTQLKVKETSVEKSEVSEKKSFSVLSQREDTSKSSAITDKWDGKGKIVDMIWE